MRRPTTRGLDLLLAAGCTALALVELFYWDEWSGAPQAAQLAGTLIICLAVAIRRWNTLVAVAAQLAGVVVMVGFGTPPEILGAGLAGMVMAYTVGAELDGRRLLAGGGMLTTAVVLHDVLDPGIDGGDVVIDVGFYAIWFAIGRIVRHRDRRVEAVTQLETDRVDDAVRAERDRIARELHDVIAHGMSVMIVQADAARHGLPEADHESRAAFAAIERTGRESMQEMRRLLDVLRGRDGGVASLTPQPGLKDLEVLATTMRDAGLPVDYVIDGEPAAIAPGLDLAAYRIVQEALTNALRHAGPARARVEVAYAPHELRLRIEDTGLPRERSQNGAGEGLIGLRERTRLYGGTFNAERSANGFVVTASLPLDAGA